MFYFSQSPVVRQQIEQMFFYYNSMCTYRLLSFLWLLYLFAVNGQGAQQQDNVSIIGPDFFVIDGSRELNLTCQTNSTSAFSYFWSLPGPRPCPSEKGNACIFQPKAEDDGGNATCQVQDASGTTILLAWTILSIYHPPSSKPKIALASNTSEPLMQGYIITCSVSGGKPLVTNVTFFCQHPDLADREDDVSDDGSTISSDVTVDVSQATEQNMTCTCFALWEPEPRLYRYITQRQFGMRYKATVQNFTVNGRTNTTVAEGENTPVTFSCEATGRPTPVLRLHKRGSDTSLGLPYTIRTPRCEDHGTYTCEADNGFIDSNRRTVQLFVRCAPRLLETSFDSSKVYNLTQAGNEFTVFGYPTPTIVARFLENGVDGTTEPASNNNGHLGLTCQRDKVLEYLVNCSVTPVSGQAVDKTFYNVTIRNELGTITLQFQVLVTGTQPNGNKTLSSGEVAGIILGTLLFVAVLIVAFIVVKRLRTAKSGDRTDHQFNVPHQSAIDTRNLPTASRTNSRGQQQQLQRRGHQQQSTNRQMHEHHTAGNELTTEAHTYVNEGNTYDVLQRNQQDDGRTYTTLGASPRVAGSAYLTPVSRTVETGD